MSRCEIAIEIDDETGKPVRCRANATHEVARWGVAWHVEVCPGHAAKALGDGCDVSELSSGERVRMGDDGIEVTA